MHQRRPDGRDVRAQELDQPRRDAVSTRCVVAQRPGNGGDQGEACRGSALGDVRSRRVHGLEFVAAAALAQRRMLVLEIPVLLDHGRDDLLAHARKVRHGLLQMLAGQEVAELAQVGLGKREPGVVEHRHDGVVAASVARRILDDLRHARAAETPLDRDRPLHRAAIGAHISRAHQEVRIRAAQLIDDRQHAALRERLPEEEPGSGIDRGGRDGRLIGLGHEDDGKVRPRALVVGSYPADEFGAA